MIRPRCEKLAVPQHDRITRSIADLGNEQAALELRASQLRRWLTEHPETTRRLQHLDTELGVIDRALGVERDLFDGIERAVECPQRSATDELLDAIPPVTQQPMQRSSLEPGLRL